jgi:hypothetical protein
MERKKYMCLYCEDNGMKLGVKIMCWVYYKDNGMKNLGVRIVNT